MRIRLIVLFLFILAGVFTKPLLAQAENQHEKTIKLLSKDSLIKFFPKEFGTYILGQISEPPFQSDPPKGIFLNAVYNSEQVDNYYFIQFAHYRSPEIMLEMLNQNWKSSIVNNTAIEQEYKGFFMREDPDVAKASVYLGEELEVSIYGGKQANIDDIYAALEKINLKGLNNLIREDNSKDETENKETGDIVEFNKFNCDSLNYDLREKMTDEMDAELVPWSHFLKANEASTAAINENEMIFPRKGNDWLQCVNKNDILWSPMEMPMFLKRVKEITINNDEVILITENAGFPDVMYRGKIKMEAGEE